MKPSLRSGQRGASRLIVVSNRLPVSFKREDGKLQAVPSSGGLIGALEPILKDHGGVWVGSAGTEDSPELHEELRSATRGLRFHYRPIILTEEEQAKYYEGFSNEVLWPLFHDLQSRCVFDPEYWDFYQGVNRKFAKAVEAVASERDVIWVHDYQLMQVARCLRERLPHAVLSFFLHIPFPSPDIFGKLPWHRQILEGLLEYDFIGLQTARDEHNLVASIRCCIDGARVTGRGEQRIVTRDHRETLIRSAPISIDFQGFAASAATPAVTERVRDLRRQAPGMEIAIGVDRLDYTKGIPERLRALRAFFRAYPELRGKITLIQVVVPSRENIPGYQELRSEIEGLVSQVNGEFAEPGWTPIQYIHRSIPRDELLALYRAAGIALVTPLKDGMNLVAKEYCACHIENDGVLILSEFAGAMPELHTGAITVHPYDEIGISDALRQALAMPLAERHRRMLRMRRTIRQHDILHWRDRIFEEIEHVRPRRKVAA
jgi:trehalose 6-phosphate synthase